MVMKQVTPGAVIQAAIPTIFKKVPTSYHREIMATVEASANLCYSKLREVAGLTPIMPAGALYIMVFKSLEPLNLIMCHSCLGQN